MPSELILTDSSFPTPSPDDLAKAVAVLWGKQIDAATADVIGSNTKCLKFITQFIEGYPIHAAMVWAMATGYMLRVQVEKQGKTLLLT